ncbi:LptF/LptG family permease [Piscinibacter koreensis]|uniref:LptF/LptG family permease n=1 Tax=Piscinibacter koreensis TaxID=2742824 RepID=A0A7Y6NLB9_9BURK|nr:LptF/LptG family permease [Schlegelella koreensis]NUZ05229.1 LptF/LptG family permease [Schlegelella koreensis]
MRPFVPDRLDRHALRLLIVPLVAALGVLLMSQLLERLLRLFDIAASSGAPLWSVLPMAANLVPHYLGMALPMAFTAAIFMAAATLVDDSELDIMLSSGRSLARIAAPYFALGALLALFNLYLFSELQPHTRYGYQVAVQRAVQTAWVARIEENRFVDTGQGNVFSADTVDADGRGLSNVFAERSTPQYEEITTAARGRLEPRGDGRGWTLDLQRGLVVRVADGAVVSTLRFPEGVASRDLTPRGPPFRPRGASVRERTSAELWRDMRSGGRDPKVAAEFHGRLARALIPPLLPLIALPLGIASKRGRRAPGVVFATLALFALHHALQFGERLADSGRVAALPALWLPFLGFALLGVWIFRRSLAWPGDNPVTRAVNAIESAFERGIREWWPSRDRERAATSLRKSRLARGTLPGYLRQRVGLQVVAVLAVLTGLMQLLDLLGVTNDVLDRGQGLRDLLHYGLLRLPAELVLGLPLAMLLGTLLALRAMALRLEIGAMRTSGVSLMRVLAYLLPLAVVLALAQFAVSERVLPRTETALRQWWNASAPADDPAARRWAHTSTGPVSIEAISPDGRHLQRLRIYQRDASGLIASRISAASARWSDQRWQLEGVTEVTLADGAVRRVDAPAREWQTNLRPDDVLRLDVSRPYLSSAMLADVLTGARVGTQATSYYRTALYRSFAAPLAVIVMLLLALPVAAALPRDRRGGRGMLAALALGLAFLLCDGMFGAFGSSGRLPAPLAAFAAPLLFGLLGLLRVRACERL